MKITCQSCQSKYTVSDEKVQGKTVKIKCRKCGATILVNSGGVTTSAPADPVSLSSGGAADGGTSYLINVAEGDQRSMTLPEIVAAYHGSVVTADTYVWADGMGDWQPLGQVDAIVAALNGQAAAAPDPDATPLVAAPTYAEPAEPEHRAAARRDPGRGARDLFGAQEAPPAAASYSAQPSAPRAMPSAPMGGRGGEENSMLFSLSALTAKPSQSASVPRATTARDREDSGIIDLKALAAAAAAQSAPHASAEASAFLPDGGLFPLGAPASPIAAPPVVSPSMPPPKSKTPIVLGLGGLVAIGAIVGVFLLARGGPPPPPPTPAAAETASAAPTATVAEAPSATPSASAVASTSPSGDPSASASALAKAGKAGKAGPGRGPAAPGPRGGPAAPAAAAPAAPAAAAPAAPKKSSCGCAAGDLMCAMKCSAK